MEKIIKVAHLVEFLCDDVPKKDKALAIKLARMEETITSDEALELAIEYL